MKEQELQDAIAQLRAEYAEQLPGTVAQMEALWRGIVAAELPVSEMAKLTRMAHSITGSGATFGIPAASDAALELEKFFARLEKGRALPTPTEQEQGAILLAALAQVAASPQR